MTTLVSFNNGVGDVVVIDLDVERAGVEAYDAVAGVVALPSLLAISLIAFIDTVQSANTLSTLCDTIFSVSRWTWHLRSCHAWIPCNEVNPARSGGRRDGQLVHDVNVSAHVRGGERICSPMYSSCRLGDGWGVPCNRPGAGAHMCRPSLLISCRLSLEARLPRGNIIALKTAVPSPPQICV